MTVLITHVYFLRICSATPANWTFLSLSPISLRTEWSDVRTHVRTAESFHNQKESLIMYLSKENFFVCHLVSVDETKEANACQT